VIKREYKSYKQYIKHQLEKSMNSFQRKHVKSKWDEDKIKHSARFECLKDYITAGKAICLAAKLGSEVEALREFGFDAIGIDIAPEPPLVIYGDFHNIPFEDNTFDLVFTNSLDHVYDLNKVGLEIERVMKPDGYVLLVVHFGVFGSHESVRIDNIDELMAYLPNFSVIYSNLWEVHHKKRKGLDTSLSTVNRYEILLQLKEYVWTKKS